MHDRAPKKIFRCGRHSLRISLKKRSIKDSSSILDESHRIIYTATTQHWQHSEQNRWTMLNNYFTGNSILLLAWGSIFASTQSGKLLVLIALSLTGVLISILWLGLEIRAHGFVKMYATLGEQLEDDFKIETDTPFISAKIYRDTIAGLARFTTSGNIGMGIPTIFLILYIFLVMYSTFLIF